MLTESQIINELDSIIAYCDVTKDKATGLRKKLSAPIRKKKIISDVQVANILAARQKNRNKKALATN